MLKEMKLKTTKIIIILVVNIILLLVLYNIPINNEETICVYKNITGKDCFNCGMTRAFLSVIHFEFEKAYQYNKNVIIVFPLTILVYLYSWLKYLKIIKKTVDKQNKRC